MRVTRLRGSQGVRWLQGYEEEECEQEDGEEVGKKSKVDKDKAMGKGVMMGTMVGMMEVRLWGYKGYEGYEVMSLRGSQEGGGEDGLSFVNYGDLIDCREGCENPFTN